MLWSAKGFFGIIYCCYNGIPMVFFKLGSFDGIAEKVVLISGDIKHTYNKNGMLIPKH